MSETSAIKTLTYDELKKAVESAAAFRCRRRLQPAGGEGDKIFPPTYSGAVYATEQRRVKRIGADGKEAWESVPCVVLDSVQSQANRMEEALQEAIDHGTLKLPYVSVDFSKSNLIDIQRVTSLEAPHRLFDAILRDSEYTDPETQKKLAFRDSKIGKTLDQATSKFAAPLFTLGPNTLVFGVWDSTGSKGGLGAKFERAIVSEIVGIGAQLGTKSSSRIDPLGIEKAAGPIYALKGSNGQKWTLDEKEAEIVEKSPVLFGGNKDLKKRGNPAAINHGNVKPTLSELDSLKQPLAGGVTVDFVEQTTTLSLIQLRRLNFCSDGDLKKRKAQNLAAQTMLAAIGLSAAVLAFEKGADLRSRCVIFPDAKMEWELLDEPGATPRKFSIKSEDALSRLMIEASDNVKAIGLTWQTDPLILTPSEQLVNLVRRSQVLTAKDGGTEG